jgi:hypothetical protein
MTIETPGKRSRAEWAQLPLGQWTAVRKLKKKDVPALLRAGHAAEMWAKRNKLRSEYRVRDGGRTLWLRIVPLDAPWNPPGGPRDRTKRSGPPE